MIIQFSSVFKTILCVSELSVNSCASLVFSTVVGKCVLARGALKKISSLRCRIGH